jgi:hypothetical protein
LTSVFYWIKMDIKMYLSSFDPFRSSMRLAG